MAFRRWPAILAGLGCLVAAAQAQDLDSLLRLSQEQLREKGVITTPLTPPERSNAASGTPPPKGDNKLPNPKQETADPDKFILQNADKSKQQGDDIEAQGNVHFLYKGYEVTCDRAFGNLKTNIFVLEGHVVLIGGDKSLVGHRVMVNFDAKTFGFLDVNAILSPSIVGPQITDNLYVRGEAGGGDEKLIEVEDAHLTTCNNEKPHFEVTARRATIRIGKRAILRDTRIKVLGRTILKIPYIVIPLEQYSERYIPEVGKTQDEGYYIKTYWLTPLKGADVLGSRIDYFEKKGLALGTDYMYSNENMEGIFRTYALTRGFKSFQSSLNHRQNIFGGQLYIDGNYSKNNYLTAPNTTTYSARASFNLPQNNGTTTFNYFKTGSSSGTFDSNQDNFGVTDSRQWSEKLQSNLTLNLSNSESKNISDTQSISQVTRQMDVDFTGSNEFNWATASLDYRRTIPIGSRENFFSTDERTPVVTLKSDARRIFGKAFSGKFPFNTEVSWGELVNSQDQSRITRTTFDMSFNKDVRAATSRHQFGVNGRFKQGIYSDDTAQYVLTGGARYSYYVDRDTNLNIRYNYLRPYGFTPLAIDRSGRSHQMTADLTYRPWDSFQLRAQAGYDFLQLARQATPWQRVSLNSEYSPTENFSFRTQTTYDTVNQVWSNVRMDLGWEVGGARISAGTNFDGQRHTWSNFNLYADGFQIGKLRAGMIFSYNGYNRQVEARHFSFTYDLHCVEAILQIIDNPVGFRSGRSINFFIRIKALPFDTPFGIGNRGQAIGSGNGIRF